MQLPLPIVFRPTPPRIPGLASLNELLAHFPDAGIPNANPTSPGYLADAFNSILNPPETSNCSAKLSWSTLKPVVERCFGKGASGDVDGSKIEGGSMGFMLASVAFDKLGIVEDEDDHIEAEMWVLKLNRAVLKKLNEYTKGGHWNSDATFVLDQFDTSCGPLVKRSLNYHEDVGSPDEPPIKRARISPPTSSGARSTERTFPSSVPIIPSLHRLYRTFPVPSSFLDSTPHSQLASLRGLHCWAPSQDEEPEAVRNAGVGFLDLYGPRWSKGTRDEKVGLCPICVEPVARGGEGDEKWLHLRNSSYLYHMNHHHGVSKATGLPFSPPKSARTVPQDARRGYRDSMLEGLCHNCEDWIPLLTAKQVETAIPELIWWKHAKACHGSSRLEGDTDVFVQDEFFRIVLELS
ncbi:hypothetical protein T439DRAFT_376808 [Meredithblackwellia eburnea MCA 4105]